MWSCVHGSQPVYLVLYLLSSQTRGARLPTWGAPLMRHSLRHNKLGHSGIRHRLKVREGGSYRVSRGGNSTGRGVGGFQSRAALRAVDLGGALSRCALAVSNRARSSTHHTAVVKNTPHASDAMSASVSNAVLVEDVGRAKKLVHSNMQGAKHNAMAEEKENNSADGCKGVQLEGVASADLPPWAARERRGGGAARETFSRARSCAARARIVASRARSACVATNRREEARSSKRFNRSR